MSNSSITPGNELSPHYVTKANSLVQLNRFIGGQKGQSLKLLEAKLLAYTISLIDQDADELLPVRFIINDFWRSCRKNPKGSNYKKMVMNAFESLRNKSGWVEIINPATGRKETTLVGLISKAKILDDDRTYEIHWDPDMKPALLHLKGNYLKYRRDDVLGLNSEYGFGLYELLCSYEYLNAPIRFSFLELAAILDGTNYNRPSIFKAKVIEAAVNDINSNSQVLRVNVTYDTVNGENLATFTITRISGKSLSVGPNGTEETNNSEIISQVKESIGYDALAEDIVAGTLPYDAKTLDLIVDIITEVLIDPKKTYSINQNRISGSKVVEVFKALDQFHVSFVLASLQKVEAEIRNPRAYIRAALYNAPTTMSLVLDAKVNADLAAERKSEAKRQLDTDEQAAIRRMLEETPADTDAVI